MRTATVYTFFDAAGAALYVGCTGRGFGRIRGHGHQDWWPEVSRIEVEHFEIQAEGRRRERVLIRELRPPHNVAANPDRDPRLRESVAA